MTSVREGTMLPAGGRSKLGQQATVVQVLRAKAPGILSFWKGGKFNEQQIEEFERVIDALECIADEAKEIRVILGQALQPRKIARILILDPETHMDVTAANLQDDEQVVYPIQPVDDEGATIVGPALAALQISVTSDDPQGARATAVLASDNSTLTVAASGKGNLGPVNFAIASPGLPTHPLAITVVNGQLAGIVLGQGVVSPLPPAAPAAPVSGS